MVLSYTFTTIAEGVVFIVGVNQEYVVNWKRRPILWGKQEEQAKESTENKREV
jgi:hypothetical protein